MMPPTRLRPSSPPRLLALTAPLLFVSLLLALAPVNAQPCIDPIGPRVTALEEAAAFREARMRALQSVANGGGISAAPTSVAFAPTSLIVRLRESFLEEVVFEGAALRLDSAPIPTVASSLVVAGSGLRQPGRVRAFLLRHQLRAIRPLRERGPLFAGGEVPAELRALRPIAARRNRERIVELGRKLDRVHVVTLAADADPTRVEGAIASLRSDPAVESVERDVVVEAAALPDDPLFSSRNSWGQGQDLPDLWGLEKIRAPAAWESHPQILDDRDLVIAVLDTGVDFRHPDLAANAFIRPDNCFDDDGNGYVGDIFGWNFAARRALERSEDRVGHGTHVAGTLAARGNNGRGMTGVTWKARIMAVKVLGDNGTGQMSWVAEGILYAADGGADVINMSLSTRAWVRRIEFLSDAVAYARALGVLSVAAAGNDSVDIGSEELGIMPAAIDNVVAVGAIDELDERASFSNGGANLSLAAPGAGSDRDEIPLSFLGIVSARSRWVNDVWPGQRVILGPNDNYYRLGGTSMAAPHVSGTAGLVGSLYPELSPELLRIALEDSAADLGDPGFDILYGHGRLDAPGTLARAGEIVAGRRAELDAGRAEGPVLRLYTGEQTYSFAFENVGLSDATDVAVTLRIDGQLADQVVVPSVPVDQEQRVEFRVGFPAPGTYRLEFTVNDPEAGPSVAEYRTTNNGAQLVVDARKALFHARTVTNPVISWDRSGLRSCDGTLVWAQENQTTRKEIRAFFWEGDDLRENPGAEAVTISLLHGDNVMPACDDRRIAWSYFNHRHQENHLVLRAADAELGVHDFLPDAGSMPLSPDLSGDRLVWIDRSGEGTRLLGLRLDGGDPEVLLPAIDPQARPRIADRHVVWEESTAEGAHAIYAMRLLPEESLRLTPPRQAMPRGRRALGTPFRISPRGSDAREPEIDGDRVVWADRRTGDLLLWSPGQRSVQTIAAGGPIGSDGDVIVHRSPAIRGRLIVWISDLVAPEGFLRASRLWVRDAGPDGRWNSPDDFGSFLIDEIERGRLSDAVVEDGVIGTLAQRWFDERPFVVAYTYERAEEN